MTARVARSNRRQLNASEAGGRSPPGQTGFRQIWRRSGGPNQLAGECCWGIAPRPPPVRGGVGLSIHFCKDYFNFPLPLPSHSVGGNPNCRQTWDYWMKGKSSSKRQRKMRKLSQTEHRQTQNVSKCSE